MIRPEIRTCLIFVVGHHPFDFKRVVRQGPHHAHLHFAACEQLRQADFRAESRSNAARNQPQNRYSFGLQWGMSFQVDAVYENGVLRPLQPLNLMEHEHVLVSVVKTALSGPSNLALDYIERIKREQEDAERTPGLEEVRRRLAKIPGSMAAEIVADRGER
jgi:predicted DNA-binding antitoxin AbrB/MazE fold protein